MYIITISAFNARSETIAAGAIQRRLAEKAVSLSAGRPCVFGSVNSVNAAYSSNFD